MSNLKKGVFLLAFSQVISRILFLVFIFFFSRLANREGLTMYTIVYIPYSLMADIASLGIFVGTNRIVSTCGNEENQNGVLLKGTIFTLILGLLFGSAMFFFPNRFLGITSNAVGSDNIFAFRIAAMTVVFYPFLYFLRGFIQGLLKTYLYGISLIIEQSVRTILIFLFPVLFKDKPIVFLVDYVLVATLFAIIISVVFLLFFLFKRYFKAKKKTSFLTYYLTICVPFGITTLFYTVYQAIDSFTFNAFLSEEAMADYFTTYLYECSRLIYIPILIAQALACSLMPRIAKMTNNEDVNRVVQKIVSQAISFLVGTVFIVSFFASEIYELFYQNTINGGIVLANVSILIYFFGLYKIILGIVQGINKISFVVWASIFSIVMKYALNVVFLPSFGYIGALYSSVISIVIAMISVACVLAFHRISIFGTIIKNTIINCLIFCVGIIAIILLKNMLFFHTPIRYVWLIYCLLYLSSYYLIRLIIHYAHNEKLIKN